MTEQEQPTVYSVYVSGAVNPTGTALIRQLTEAGHSVSALAANAAEAHDLREAGALPVYGDPANKTEVRHNLKLAEVDTVINLEPQQYNTPPLTRRQWAADADTLRARSTALLDAAKEAEVAFVLHTSYAFLYADTGDTPADEDTPARDAGNNLFIAAALDVEQRVMALGGAVLRVGYLFGTESLHDVEAVLRRNLPMYYGKPGSMANFLHNVDLIPAIVAAVEARTANARYNIVSNTPMTVHDFVSMFGEKLGLSAPSSMPGLAAQTVYGRGHVALLNASVALSNDHAKSQLDWSPRFDSVDASLEDILLTWRMAVS